MSDRLNINLWGAPPPVAVPELVEVVYMPASHSTLIRELARARCEADEALEALIAWRNRFCHAVGKLEWLYVRTELQNLIPLLDHVIDHVRWVQDPKA